MGSVLLCACGGNKPHGGGGTTAREQAPIENKQVEAPPPAPPTGPFMEMEGFARDMCACAPGDAECAKRVSDQMTKWSQEAAAKTKKSTKMSEAEMKQATEIGTRMGQCMQTAMTPPPP